MQTPVEKGQDAAKTIVVVDNDVGLIKQLDERLAEQGYRVLTAEDCRGGLMHVINARPDLIIVDAALANTNGMDGCKRIRDLTDAPMMILAEPGEEETILLGLREGADDFITKPFGTEDLVTRARVLLARAKAREREADKVAYQDDYLAVNLEDRRVMVGGQLVQLTPTELRFLGCLVQNAGKVMSYEQLLEAVWGKEYLSYADYVRIYTWRLRRKIEKNPRSPQYILTEHGTGYRFEGATA
jgi:two-component system KDP operon response regulator KdpE